MIIGIFLFVAGVAMTTISSLHDIGLVLIIVGTGLYFNEYAKLVRKVLKDRKN